MTLLGVRGALAFPARSPDMGSMLWNYTLDYFERLDRRRRARLQALKTAEDVEELQRKVRAGLAEMWGPLPTERTPLNPRHLGTLERSDYWVEKIIYESRPEFFVTANLYRPKGIEGRLPALILPPDDSPEGKAAGSRQRLCVRATRAGFIVLTWDAIGQGERLQLWDPDAEASLAGESGGENPLLARQCFLLGLNLMQYRLWDAARAVDYLGLLSDADPDRIGIAGVAGGGSETIHCALLETRLNAAFPVAAGASLLERAEALLPSGPEQVLYGALKHGIDDPELLLAIAPRRLVIGLPGSVSGAEAPPSPYEAVAAAYKLLGAEQNIRLLEARGESDTGRRFREAATLWLGDAAANPSPGPAELAIELATEKELRCTTSGQVSGSLAGATVLSANQAYAGKIAPQREAPRQPSDFELYRSEIAEDVRQITRVGSFEPEMGIWVPDRVFEVGAFARGVAVVIAEAGKDHPAVRRSVIDPILSAGYQVIALDLRGWGETSPQLSDLKEDIPWEDFFAYRALEMGRPMLGQRMKDLLAAVPRRTKYREWTVVGIGAGALVAAHAAVLEPRIQRLVSIGGLLSYRSLIDDPLTKQPFSSFLPGVIGAYDIRDLYASLAPRPTLVLNPQDSQRRTTHPVAAWEELDWAAQVYENIGATDRFSMHSQLSARKMRQVLMEWLAT